MRAPARFAAVALLLGDGLSCKGLTPYNPSGIIDESGIPDTESDTDTDTDTDSDTDTDTDLDPLSVNSIEPAYGTAAGGTAVTIIGGPFDPSARVFFGTGSDETEAVVQTANANQIVATTPAYAGAPGPVDVKVATDTRVGAGNSIFQFFEDGTGLYGTLGEFSLTFQTGNYWESEPTSAERYWVTASVYFVLPDSVSWTELLYAPQTMDSCRLEYEYSGSIDVYTPDVPGIRLALPTSGSVNIEQHSSYDYLYYAVLTPQDYIQGGTYDLMPMVGSTSDWPAIEGEDFVRVPAAFQVTAPAVNADIPPLLSRSNFNLNWSGAGSGDYMLAVLGRYQGGAHYEYVTCVMRDDGSFKVPSSAFSGWQAEQQMNVWVGRVWEPYGTLPHDNSDSGVLGIYWVYGAGFQN